MGEPKPSGGAFLCTKQLTGSAGAGSFQALDGVSQFLNVVVGDAAWTQTIVLPQISTASNGKVWHVIHWNGVGVCRLLAADGSADTLNGLAVGAWSPFAFPGANPVTMLIAGFSRTAWRYTWLSQSATGGVVAPNVQITGTGAINAGREAGAATLGLSLTDGVGFAGKIGARSIALADFGALTTIGADSVVIGEVPNVAAAVGANSVLVGEADAAWTGADNVVVGFAGGALTGPATVLGSADSTVAAGGIVVGQAQAAVAAGGIVMGNTVGAVGAGGISIGGNVTGPLGADAIVLGNDCTAAGLGAGAIAIGNNITGAAGLGVGEICIGDGCVAQNVAGALNIQAQGIFYSRGFD